MFLSVSEIKGLAASFERRDRKAIPHSDRTSGWFSSGSSGNGFKTLQILICRSQVRYIFRIKICSFIHRAVLPVDFKVHN